LFTHLSHLINGNPGDGDKVIIAAQDKISAAAVRSALIARAEANTRVFLTKFLGRFGYRHVTVIFG